MACSINATTWNSASAIGGILLAEDGIYLLRIELDSGTSLDLPLDSGNPLALQISDEIPRQVEYVEAGWREKCKYIATTTFKLDPRHTVGNFSFRKDGTGIGISDIRDDSFRAIYINLIGFPITLERVHDDVFLRFQNDTLNYYISPKFTTG